VNDRRFPRIRSMDDQMPEAGFHIKMLLSCLTCPSVISIVSETGRIIPMTKEPIETKRRAGHCTYSQAIRTATRLLSGQIGLDPETMQMAEGIEAQAHRVFQTSGGGGSCRRTPGRYVN